jgi:hypothetical protein
MKFKSIFLLFVFFFLKVGVAHSLSHTFSDNHADECEQCFLIVDSNKTQTFDGTISAYSNNFIKKDRLPKPSLLLYKNPIIVKENNRFYFFNKPPPSL